MDHVGIGSDFDGIDKYDPLASNSYYDCRYSYNIKYYNNKVLLIAVDTINNTVEPPNKGHFGNRPVVLCSEVVPISEVHQISIICGLL